MEFMVKEVQNRLQQRRELFENSQMNLRKLVTQFLIQQRSWSGIQMGDEDNQ